MAWVHLSFSLLGACILLVSILVLFLSPFAPADAQDRRDEVRTLLNFKQMNVLPAPYLWFFPFQDGGGGYWNTWKESDENPCAWVGVTCTANFTVEELDLSGWGLLEFVVLEPLSVLRDLRHLDLSSNSLGLAGIPLDIRTLTGLTWLDISQNGARGEIPANISACRMLRYISLERNFLEGVIPSSLRELRDLQVLLLADNQLSGPLPEVLGELSSLVRIDLSNNSFNGSIPALSNLTRLVSLKLDNNTFTKFEESWFSTLAQSLQLLSVSFNQMEGVLPPAITLPYLQVFNLSCNRLSGRIPFFSHQDNITLSLDLSQNNFTGEIPSDLLGFPFGLSSVNLSYNLLSGNLPLNSVNNSVCALDLSYNNLSGLMMLSNLLGNDQYFYSLWLGNNQLSGDIVDLLNFTTNGGIYDLRLGNNLLTGDLSRLVDTNYELPLFPPMLDLTSNQLQWSTSEAIPDPIAVTLQRLTNDGFLQEFRVGGNNFSGTSLPSACFDNKASGNSSGLKMKVLDLSKSHLKGKISDAAFNSTCLPFLRFLSLSNNDITGPVPDGIVRLQHLEVLDLSNNHLSGHLPLVLTNTSLNNPSFFEGNDGLCGYPLQICPQDFPHAGVHWWVLLIIIGGCVIIAMGSCLAATWRWRVYHKRHEQDADLIRTLLERECAALISFRELKKATENFSVSAQIGEGGFGTVYLGKLTNGTIVAIKRSKREGSERDKEQFLNEVRILSQVSHRNLVKLLGCCMENKIAVLVFEFVSNGTLQDHLQGKLGAVCLTWEKRLKIAAQTADALYYLHSSAVCPIYHRDVKSANILLDDNLNAKVADFGISKLAPLQATHVSTVMIQGTIGYIDPEYYTSCQLTDKSDVYSFGVVLLELISAKPALDFFRGGNETNLVNFAIPYIERGELQGFIDPALSETYSDVVGNGRESILTFGKLAIKCLVMPSKARPSMQQVLRELQNLWADFGGTSEEHLEESINEEDKEDLRRGQIALFSHILSKDSSSFAMHSDPSGLQMSQLAFGCRNCNSA